MFEFDVDRELRAKNLYRLLKRIWQHGELEDIPCSQFSWSESHAVYEKYIFDVEGDVNKFIKKITENKVSSFKSIEPDLEEIFLSFYKKGKKNVK